VMVNCSSLHIDISGAKWIALMDYSIARTPHVTHARGKARRQGAGYPPLPAPPTRAHF